MSGVFADAAVEAAARQVEPLREALIGEGLVPSRQPALAILRVLATQDFVERVSQRRFAALHLIVFDHFNLQNPVRRDVILEQFPFAIAALQSRGEEVRGIRADLAAEEVERIGVPEIDVLLDDVERNAAKLARVAVSALFHQLRAPPDHTPDAGLRSEE